MNMLTCFAKDINTMQGRFCFNVAALAPDNGLK